MPLSFDDVINAFSLPANCRVDQRIAKTLLLENGAPTAADKRTINEGIEEAMWIAALKPQSIAVPLFRNEEREYLEIAIVSLRLRPAANEVRLAELVHRAIPYPVVLLVESDQGLIMSFSHKRWAHNEMGKMVLDEAPITLNLLCNEALTPELHSAFLASLPIQHQPCASLNSLYQGWIDKLIALKAAIITGNYAAPQTPEQALARRAALHRCYEIDNHIKSLQLAATKETQLARQVDLNMNIKALLAEREQAAQHL